MVIGQQQVGQREQSGVDDARRYTQQQDTDFAGPNRQHNHSGAVDHQTADVNDLGTINWEID